MLIECSRCGAPLNVPDRAKIVRCNYCRSSHRVHATRTLAPHTPQGWVPPPTWTPPQHAPHPSHPLSYHTQRSPLIGVFVAVGFSMVLGMAVAVFAVLGRSGSTAGVLQNRVAAADLARAQLAQTPTQFVERYPAAKLSDARATLSLSGSVFDMAVVEWNDERSHIVSVSLIAPDGVSNPGTLVAGLKQHLGHRLDTSQQGAINLSYHPAQAGLSMQADGSHLGIRSRPSNDQRSDWKARGRALWQVLAAVGLGVPVTLDTTARELLAGHDLNQLAKVDPSVVVDQAEAHVNSILTGAVTSQTSDLEIHVLTNHPWFGSALLSWENKADSPMVQVKLWHPVGSPDLPNQADIARCLEPVLGQPEIEVSDHLKGLRSYRWKGSDYWKDGAHMGRNNIWFRMPPTSKAKKRYRQILSTLDRCGRLK